MKAKEMLKKRKLLVFALIVLLVFAVVTVVLYFSRPKAPPFPLGVAWSDKATARQANLAQKYVGGAFAPGAMVIFPEQFQAQAAAQAPSEEQLEELSWQLLDLYYQFRQENGLPQGLATGELKNAAWARAWNEGSYNSFDHFHTEETGEQVRYNYAIRRFGFVGLQSLECLAAFPAEWQGRNVAQDVFNAWKASPSHKSALLWQKTQTVGFAFVWVEGSTYGLYVVFLGGYDNNSYQPLPRPGSENLFQKVYIPFVAR